MQSFFIGTSLSGTLKKHQMLQTCPSQCTSSPLSVTKSEGSIVAYLPGKDIKRQMQSCNSNLRFSPHHKRIARTILNRHGMAHNIHCVINSTFWSLYHRTEISSHVASITVQQGELCQEHRWLLKDTLSDALDFLWIIMNKKHIIRKAYTHAGNTAAITPSHRQTCTEAYVQCYVCQERNQAIRSLVLLIKQEMIPTIVAHKIPWHSIMRIEYKICILNSTNNTTSYQRFVERPA